MKSRSVESFEDDLVKIAAQKEYHVFGGDPRHPEGGIFFADSPKEAFAKFILEESGGELPNLKHVMTELDKEMKEQNLKMEEVGHLHWQYGAYDIKEKFKQEYTGEN